jgi:ketosteroid isomerase-like protein
MAAPGTHQPADTLSAAVEAYDRATIGNDTRALAALVTDDYMLVNSDASVQDKASYLADFAVPGFKIDPYRMEPAFSRIHADTALTGGAFRLRWVQDGRRQSRRLRAVHFWVRRQGRWRLAYTQLTRVPE